MLQIKTSKSSLEDVIGKMPENVITNIMDRLPLQDAVRTSILSTNWRYKWNLLSQVVFDYDFFQYLLLKNGGKYNGKIISRLLLHLITGGVITTFSLYKSDESKLDDEDISHWLLFLSRIRIKNLTIWTQRKDLTKLPTHFFSCLELKHLELHDCCIHPPPNFRGFPNLLSLKLYEVKFQSYECGELFSQCPLLEILNFDYDEVPSSSCKVKLVDITKLQNLKTLVFSLFMMDDMTRINVSSILHHLCLLPKLQELTLCYYQCEFLAESVNIKQISTVFPCLKSLDLVNIDLRCDIMVSFAFGIIFSSPNLQTLNIVANYVEDVELPDICFTTEVDSNTMGPLQLRNVGLLGIIGLKNELYMIKSILACSPVLKKFKIRTESSCEGGDEMYEVASKLLKLHRASPEAEIDF